MYLEVRGIVVRVRVRVRVRAMVFGLLWLGWKGKLLVGYSQLDTLKIVCIFICDIRWRILCGLQCVLHG